MLNNLLNFHDIIRIIEKFREGQSKNIFKKIFSSRLERVTDSWKHTKSPPVNWENIPAVKEYIDEAISGNAGINHRSYIKQTHLQQHKNLTALSLGCGVGQNELAWAEMDIFQRIDAFDISAKRIEQARRSAAEKGCENIVKFSVANAQNQDLGKAKYDLVLFEGSLHHFSPMEEILQKVNKCLKPGGLLVVFDFVGPSRFQWTERQLSVANALLQILPERYKRVWPGASLKKRIYRPGRLFMVLRDPSEAAASSHIMPCLRQLFDIIEIKEIGGAVLHLLFSGIAHNFQAQDGETRSWLQVCFTVEKMLLKSQAINSDFVLVISRKKEEKEPAGT